MKIQRDACSVYGKQLSADIDQLRLLQMHSQMQWGRACSLEVAAGEWAGTSIQERAYHLVSALRDHSPGVVHITLIE